MRVFPLAKDCRSQAGQHKHNRNSDKPAAIRQPVNLDVLEDLNHDYFKYSATQRVLYGSGAK